MTFNSATYVLLLHSHEVSPQAQPSAGSGFSLHQAHKCSRFSRKLSGDLFLMNVTMSSSAQSQSLPSSNTARVDHFRSRPRCQSDQKTKSRKQHAPLFALTMEGSLVNRFVIFCLRGVPQNEVRAYHNNSNVFVTSKDRQVGIRT